jgi:hypothetical protein
MSDEGFDAICDEWIAEAQAERARQNSAEYLESAAILKALRLAPTLAIGEALLRGEKVPAAKLDAGWLRAYGRRT